MADAAYRLRKVRETDYDALLAEFSDYEDEGSEYSNGEETLDSEEDEEEGMEVDEVAHEEGMEVDEVVDVPRSTWIEEPHGQHAPAPQRFAFTKLCMPDDVPLQGVAMDFFNLYFTEELMELISSETMRYARQKGDAQFTTDSNELRVYFALHMLQHIIMKPNYGMYWTKNKLLESPFFGDCMSRARFEILKKYLHFADNETFNERTHPNAKLHKIWPIYDYLTPKFKSHFSMPRDVTIDESLMLYKGRLGWVQYIPLKRARFGIKFYMLCDSKSGYVWSTEIYTGKGSCENPYYSTYGKATQIVMTLMEPLLDKGYCLTTDNFYTSPELAELLMARNTDIYGTARKCRKEMPVEIRSKKKLKKEESIAFRRGKMVVMKWADKKELTLLSTVHSSERLPHQRHRELIQLPVIVKDYNYTMGGVDRVDQSLSAYPIMRSRGKKYYVKIFFHLMELVVYNSYILYKQNGGNKNTLAFRIELISQLVGHYRVPEERKKGGRRSTVETPLRLSGRHFASIYKPDDAKGRSPRRICVVCSKKKVNGKRLRKDSRYECKACDVGLCVEPCFEVYHTKCDLEN